MTTSTNRVITFLALGEEAPDHSNHALSYVIHIAAVRPQPKGRKVLPTNSRKQRMGKPKSFKE
ncbi:MAG: hypothetical protein O2857_29825, partial [Planctomycetota bacterium]|nr:hypothetical protein [Planctomycetota bacterium]